MRTSRLLFLSVVALVSAAAQAGLLATASSITTATYRADASVTLSNLVGEEYTFGFPDFNNDVDGGGAVGRTSGSTINSFDGSQLVMGAMTSATLLANTPGYSRYSVSIGYAYTFDLTNASGVDQTVVFSLASQQTAHSSVTGKAWTEADPNGQYAQGVAYGGVEPLNGTFDGSYSSFGSTTYDFDLNDDFDVVEPFRNRSATRTFSFTIAAGRTQSFELWASSSSFVDYTPAPVPEPASMAALGVGAAALLRRRKRA